MRSIGRLIRSDPNARCRGYNDGSSELARWRYVTPCAISPPAPISESSPASWRHATPSYRHHDFPLWLSADVCGTTALVGERLGGPESADQRPLFLWTPNGKTGQLWRGADTSARIVSLRFTAQRNLNCAAHTLCGEL
jgi:hypothetical protein